MNQTYQFSTLHMLTAHNKRDTKTTYHILKHQVLKNYLYFKRNEPTDQFQNLIYTFFPVQRNSFSISNVNGYISIANSNNVRHCGHIQGSNTENKGVWGKIGPKYTLLDVD